MRTMSHNYDEGSQIGQLQNSRGSIQSYLRDFAIADGGAYQTKFSFKFNTHQTC